MQPKPQVERIWLWIKDHPRSAPKAIAAALGLRREIVQVALTNMFNRGMVIKVQSDLRDARKNFMLWSVEPAMIRYELLPKLSETEKIRKENLAKGCKTMLAASALKIGEPVKVFNPNVLDVESMSLKEARALYDKLKPYFS